MAMAVKSFWKKFFIFEGFLGTRVFFFVFFTLGFFSATLYLESIIGFSNDLYIEDNGQSKWRDADIPVGTHRDEYRHRHRERKKKREARRASAMDSE